MSINLYVWKYVIPTSNVIIQLKSVLQCIECQSSIGHSDESTNSVLSCFMEGHCCIRKGLALGLTSKLIS
jgi:hypothetical protein